MSADSSVIANIAKLESNEKEVILTGDAAAAFSGGGKRRRAPKSRRLRGGDNSGGLLQVSGQGNANTYMPMEPQATSETYATAYQDAVKQLPLLQATQNMQKGGDSTGAIVNLASTRSITTPGSVQNNGPVPSISGKSIETLAPALIGGVILKPRRNKISLKAPRKLHIIPTANTRKAPRKILLGIKNLKTRLNRAKKAHAHAQTLNLQIVKQRLVKSGVIKPNSKAQESILRTMYADLLVTKKGL